MTQAQIQLRPYQVAAAQRLARGEAVGLWMAAGLGKTATVLHAWDLLGRPAPMLVITRPIGRHVWPRDAAWLLGAPTFGVVWGGAQKSKTGKHKDGTYSSIAAALADHTGVVVNYEILKKRKNELLQVPWRVLVFDEAHAIKMGWQAQKQRRDGSWVETQFSEARYLARRVAKRGRVWQITATPICDRVRDLWGQLNIALPQEFPNRVKYGWLERYCGAHINEWGGLDSTGATNTDELRQRLERHYVLLDRANVADQLPSISRDVRVITSARAATLITNSYESAIAHAASLKTEDAVDLAVEYLTGKAKCVITTLRRKHAAVLYQAMVDAVFHDSKNKVNRYVKNQVRLHAVTGETPPLKRSQEINEFNNYNGPGCLVATVDSISESVNLHHVDGLIVAALPYTPRQLVQLEGRVGRLGGTPCTIHYLVAADTIDEQVRSVLLAKLDAVTEAGTDTQGGTGAAQSLHDIYDDAEVLNSLITWLEENQRSTKK